MSEKKNNDVAVPVDKLDAVDTRATGFQVYINEFKKDKLGLAVLIFLVTIIATIFIWSLFIDQDKVMKVSLLDMYTEPNSEFLLGTDKGGRDILGQLIIGARNSIFIGFSITILTAMIGITIGLLAGYYGGIVDNIIMRIIDFVLILPTLMLIIVVVTIIPKFNAITFIIVLSSLYWVGKARLVRSKALTESRRDYVYASKTMGTPDWKIMFFNILPNISSIIIVNLVINFAGNIGIETGLTYLGFGLPTSTPSLGTLVGYASQSEVLTTKLWIWLPAAILILILMLSINFVGQIIKRASNARQRLS